MLPNFHNEHGDGQKKKAIHPIHFHFRLVKTPLLGEIMTSNNKNDWTEQ